MFYIIQNYDVVNINFKLIQTFLDYLKALYFIKHF